MKKTLNNKAAVEQFLNETPKEFEYFVQHSMEFASMIDSILKSDKNLNQRKLAQKIGKEESEISKWLSGNHNLTLRSISKLEAALNRQLFFTRSEIVERFIPYLFRQMSSSFIEKEQLELAIHYYSFLDPLEDDSTFEFHFKNELTAKSDKNIVNKPIFESELELSSSGQTEFFSNYCYSQNA